MPLRIYPIPNAYGVIDLLGRIDKKFLEALLAARSSLDRHAPTLGQHLTPEFEEYPLNFRTAQDPVANSALSLTSFIQIVADRVLRDQAVLNGEYPEDPFWPLLALYGAGYSQHAVKDAMANAVTAARCSG